MPREDIVRFHKTQESYRPKMVAKTVIKQPDYIGNPSGEPTNVYTDYSIKIFECKQNGNEHLILDFSGQDFSNNKPENRSLIMEIEDNWEIIKEEDFEELKLN